MSGRSYSQMMVVSRLLGVRDFISDFGAIIHTEAGDMRLGDAGTVDRFKREFLPDLLGRFTGYLERHDPWFEHARYTVLLRGCVETRDSYLPDAVNRYLKEAGFETWHMVDNGPTSRNTALLCDNIRIYHIKPRSMSKLAAAKKYLAASDKAPVFAIGDSPSDLELATISKLFFFAGTEEELTFYINQLDLPVERERIIVLNSRGPEAFHRAVHRLAGEQA